MAGFFGGAEIVFEEIFTQMYEDKLLQLLCSNDSRNVLLALHFFEGMEDISDSLQIAIGLCYFMNESDIAGQAKAILQRYMGEEKFVRLTEGLSILARADFVKYSMKVWRLEKNQVIKKPESALKIFYQFRYQYAKIIPLHPYYLNLYLKAGIFFLYQVKIFNKESRQLIESVLQYYPKHPYALFNMGYHHQCSKKHPSQALQYYQLFLKHYPNLSPDTAMKNMYKNFNHLNLNFPTTFNAYQNIGYLYQYQLEDNAKAIDYYWKAKNHAPQNADFAFDCLSKLLWKEQGNSTLALKVVQEGLIILEQKDLILEGFLGMMSLALINRKKHLQELGNTIQEELNQKAK